MDLTHSSLVMGILTSFASSADDAGAGDVGYPNSLWQQAERHLVDGADILDVGGVTARGVVSEQEELDRLLPIVAGLHQRFETPVSVDTCRASVAAEAYKAGAVLANDPSGFADPDFLSRAVEHAATVVVTHSQLAAREGGTAAADDVVSEVEQYLADRARQARKAGVSAERIIVHAGLDRGKNQTESQQLLLASERLAALGYPLLLSVSEAWEATVASHAIGVSLGVRIVRAHDVTAARRVCNTISAISSVARTRVKALAHG